jgi:hypothetical protein
VGVKDEWRLEMFGILSISLNLSIVYPAGGVPPNRYALHDIPGKGQDGVSVHPGRAERGAFILLCIKDFMQHLLDRALL